MISIKDLRNLKIDKNLTYKNELLRKFIHVFDSIIPLSLFVLSRENLIKIIVPVTILFILMDFLRHHIKSIQNIYLFFFDRITRNFEKTKNVFTGATYYLLGCLFVIVFFDDKSIIMASLLIMSISDSFAAIIGIKFGQTKIYKNKSLEGSFAFFITAFIILVFFVPDLKLIFSILIAFIATLVELFSFHSLNDNITIPVFSSILIQLFL